ncbi:hypothetical protein [Kitasatospora sp. NPDC059673]|uniref:hypothetical protein n=1 Tax=Kitasatospora sp. NPDC059673 TaxID=3346901 RepID=UPI0036A01521
MASRTSATSSSGVIQLSGSPNLQSASSCADASAPSGKPVATHPVRSFSSNSSTVTRPQQSMSPSA